MPANPVLRAQAQGAEARLERIIAEDPEPLSEAFSDVVRRLVRLRDELIDHRRRGVMDEVPPDWLDRTNAVLSLLVGAEYPVKAFHWDNICQARDALREMLAAA
jgi:hypothetical protein